MPSPEASHGGYEHPDRQPDVPLLSPEMVNLLRNNEDICIIGRTHSSTVVVIKAPGIEIENVRGSTPIEVRHELYEYPTSPVIRLMFVIFDQPKTPLLLETFIDVADPIQQDDYRTLANQSELRFMFYDESVQHQLTRVVPLTNQDEMQLISLGAAVLLEQIPEHERDFEQAKAAVIAANP